MDDRKIKQWFYCVAGVLTLTSCEKEDFTDAIDDTIENADAEDGVDFGDNGDEILTMSLVMT